MNTRLSLEQKELKQKALERFQKEKEKLAKELKDIETVYVSYLNESRTEMDFWFINIDSYNNKPFLDRIYISRPYYMDETNKDEYNLSPIIDLPFKDKPTNYEKARSKDGGYCFRAGGGGYDKADHCIDSLFSWLYGYGVKETPRVEKLN